MLVGTVRTFLCCLKGKTKLTVFTAKLFLIMDILPDKDSFPRAFITVFRLPCLSHLVVIEKKSVRAQF